MYTIGFEIVMVPVNLFHVKCRLFVKKGKKHVEHFQKFEEKKTLIIFHIRMHIQLNALLCF